MRTDLLIIGGGLTGLAAARLEAAAGRSFRLIEARARLGGRILSRRAPGGDAKYDLGPAWFWPGQQRMARLVAALRLRAFRQHSEGGALWQDEGGRAHPAPALGPPAFRIEGGVASVIDALAARLPQGSVETGVRATALRWADGFWRVGAADADGPRFLEARRVLVALPPRLAAASIDFGDSAPEATLALLRRIPTWMAGHAKLLAVYERPYWRAAGFAGAAFSMSGPLAEIHDASPHDGVSGALFGFVRSSAEERAEMGAEKLKAAALRQLGTLFGSEAAEPTHVDLVDWSEEPFTAVADDRAPLYAHPAYELPEEVRALDARGLVFASTELAPTDGGLLEGALAAAEEARKRLEAVSEGLSVPRTGR